MEVDVHEISFLFSAARAAKLPGAENRVFPRHRRRFKEPDSLDPLDFKTFSEHQRLEGSGCTNSVFLESREQLVFQWETEGLEAQRSLRDCREGAEDRKSSLSTSLHNTPCRVEYTYPNDDYVDEEA